PGAGRQPHRGRGRDPGQRAARQEPARAAPRQHRDREPRGGHRAAGRAGQGRPPPSARPGDLAGERHRPGPAVLPPGVRDDRRRGARHRAARTRRGGAPDPQRNAGQLWTPAHRPGPVYVKRQLLPFGESIPFRGLLSHITSLVALQPHDFTPGHRPVVFRAGPIRLGDVICYEVGFDGLVSSEVKAGANLLAVQTNDASFEVDGQRGESLQQLAMARIRAVESDRAVVVTSTTGVSAIIAPDGTVLAHSGTWRQAVLEARVPLLHTITLATRLGAWPELVITALTVGALGWAAPGWVAAA